MDLMKTHIDEANRNPYRDVLEKTVDLLLRELKVPERIEPEYILNKITGFSAGAGLDDIKERIINGM